LTRLPLARPGTINSKLQALEHGRRIAAWGPDFGVIPFVFANVAPVFATGRRFAERLASIVLLRWSSAAGTRTDAVQHAVARAPTLLARPPLVARNRARGLVGPRPPLPGGSA
jgi:hypothetical protein